ncbi:hypothetical protein D3C84_1165900 [compost metagenome]
MKPIVWTSPSWVLRPAENTILLSTSTRSRRTSTLSAAARALFCQNGWWLMPGALAGISATISSSPAGLMRL